MSDFWTAALLTFAVVLGNFVGQAQSVSGIGQPSYYWKDGNWVPYATPAQSGRVATASSTGGLGQPNTGIGQRTIGIDQPNTAPGQTTIGIGQNSTGIGQTTIGIGQPTTGIGKTTIGIGQPTIGIGQQAGGIGQPTIGIGQQNTGLGQPTIGIGQPNTGIGQPTIGIGQQMNFIPPARKSAWPRTNGPPNWQYAARNWHQPSQTRTNRVAGPRQPPVKKQVTD